MSYKVSLVMRSRELRKRETYAEQLLWDCLRGKKLRGLKFCRQLPLGRFILDFYCASAKIAIEVDGPIHENPQRAERDTLRDEYFHERGIRTLRFSNAKVQRDLHAVTQKILKACMSAPTMPKRPD